MDLDILRPFVEVITEGDGLGRQAALVFTRLLLAPIVRPRQELVDHLRRYGELAPNEVPAAIEELIRKGLLTERHVSGPPFVAVSQDWILSATAASGVPAERLENAFRSLADSRPDRNWILRNL